MNEKWLYITAGLLCCGFVIGSFVCSDGAQNGGAKLVGFSICVNFATSLVIFMAVAFLIRSDKESYENDRWQVQIVEPLLKAVSSTSGVNRIGSIEWGSLINSAQQIEFLVQSWKVWPQTVSDELEAFFRRNGVFHLFIYHPDDPAAEQARQLLRARKPDNKEDPGAEITEMVSELQAILLKADGKPEQLKITYISEVNWYCAVRFNKRPIDDNVSGRDVIVFSLYSHMHKMVSWHDLPAFVVYPDVSPNVARWFNADLARLQSSLNYSNGEETQEP